MANSEIAIFLGPILLGTILNILLYGIMITQTTMYYVSFPRDHKWIKALVAWLFAIDTLNSAFDIIFVWQYTITLFGNMEGLTHSHWSLNIEPVMTVMISSTTQSFFAWRVAKLTGQPWLGWLIGLSAFIQFASGFGLTIGLFIVRDFARFNELNAAVIIWLVLSAVTDILITSILSWYLHTHRTGFPKTDDIITRLVRLTVQTGLITTVWATIDLVLFLTMHNNMHLVFQLPLCKLYTNSLMSTLNSRAGWGGSFSSGGDPASRSGAGGSQNHRNTPAVWHSEQAKSHQTTIQVVTTATVHRDDGFELSEYSVNDNKHAAPGDIEEFTHSRSKTEVKLPGVAPSTIMSDEASMHSKLSFDPK